MLDELLRGAADTVPRQPALLVDGGTVTYADWWRSARAVAAGLREHDVDRFGCWTPAPADALAVLAGASLAGAEACLYPRALDGAGVCALADRLGHPVVVTDGGTALDSPRALALNDLLGDPATAPLGAETPGDRPHPVLILTTGSTGAPKGTRHDWSRLARAVRHPDETPGTRWLLAYNLNQFAGIQIMLHALRSRATLVAPRSSQARDVLEAMRSTGTTHVSATPTFWRLLVGGLDDRAHGLALEQITLGGEPTPESLLQRLEGLFPTARISHVYAGTEFGSAVSVRDGHAGLPVSVLDRGEDADVQLKVVDGELHVRSRVGMLGYQDGGGDAHDWHATGDLVEVSEDRVRFVGRTTEVINVGGAKVHPLPIEELACSVDGVALASAYGRPNPITGQIVTLDVVLAPGRDEREAEAAIRAACDALPAPGRPRRIRFVPELAVRGNKLVRGQQEAQT